MKSTYNNRKLVNNISNIDYILKYISSSTSEYFLKKYKYNIQSINKLIENKTIMLCNKSYLNKNNLLINNVNDLYKNVIDTEGLYIQEFIKNPLTYRKNFISIRVYLVIIKELSNLIAFLYNDGIMFLISETNNKTYLYPNYFINIFGKWNYINLIKPQIKDCIVDILENTYQKLSCPNNKIVGFRCYDLLSFDFVCNCDYKVFLIDSNIHKINIPNNQKYFKANLNFEIRNIIKIDKLFLTTKADLGNFENIFIKNTYPVIAPFTTFEGFGFKEQVYNELDPRFLFGYLNREYHDNKVDNQPITLYFIIFLIVIINIFIILYFFTGKNNSFDNT